MQWFIDGQLVSQQEDASNSDATVPNGSWKVQQAPTPGEYAQQQAGKAWSDVKRAILPSFMQEPSDTERQAARARQNKQLEATGYAPFLPWEHGGNPLTGAVELGAMLPFGAVGAGAKAAAAGAGKVLPAIFAGPLAKTADLAAMKTAQKMAAEGATAHDIWNATGWFQGADSKWRFEIPDNELALKRLPRGEGEKLNQVLENSDLYKNYPNLAKTTIAMKKGYSGAEYSPSKPGTLFPPKAGDKENIKIGSEAPNIRSKLAHEIQHAIQQREGFDMGTDPIAVGWEGYIRSSGETEARNVEKRLDFSPEERRANPPWTTEDVPREQQIVTKDDSP